MTSPCVYALIHAPSGHVYIGSAGSATKRELQWTQRLAASLKWCASGMWRSGATIPKRFFDFPWLPREWSFVILETFPADVDNETLKAAEQCRISDALSRNGPLCLNTAKTAVRSCKATEPASAYPGFGAPWEPGTL